MSIELWRVEVWQDGVVVRVKCIANLGCAKVYAEHQREAGYLVEVYQHLHSHRLTT